MKIVKRIIDIWIGSFLFCCLLPLLAFILLLELFISKGHPIFKQERIGRNSKIFTIYKFRTLRPTAPAYASTKTLNVEELAFPFGNFLRKTGLDELPQLVNIIKGDMSFVGPRPLIAAERTNDLRWHCGIDTMRPGLTGLAQIHGGNTLSDEDKVSYDFQYVETWSLWKDVVILKDTLKWLVNRLCKANCFSQQ